MPSTSESGPRMWTDAGIPRGGRFDFERREEESRRKRVRVPDSLRLYVAPWGIVVCAPMLRQIGVLDPSAGLQGRTFNSPLGFETKGPTLRPPPRGQKTKV